MFTNHDPIRRSLCVSVVALVKGRNASLLDERYKNQATVCTHRFPDDPLAMKPYIVQNSRRAGLSLSCAQAQDWATLEIFS